MNNKFIKILTCIMMLVLLVTTSVIPVMAATNTTTVNVHYVVADTSLKDFYTSQEYYYFCVGFDTAEEAVKLENKWESNYLYPNIKNGSIAIYEPEDYIKKKAEESQFDIPQNAVNDLINKAKEYDYSFTTACGKNFVFNEKTYNPISLYGQDGELWKGKDYFEIIGCLVDDYTDYNNNDYIKGKSQYGTNGYILNANKSEMTIYVLMTPTTYVDYNFIDNTVYSDYKINDRLETDANTTKEDIEKYITKQSKFTDKYQYYKYVYDNVWEYKSSKYGSPHTIIDTRNYIDVFDDVKYPMSNYVGYSFDNIEVSSQYKVENNIITIMPFAFSSQEPLGHINLNYKNTSSHSIRFEDTDGNAVPFNLKGLVYDNYMASYYPNSFDHTKYISLETDANPYSTKFDDDFFVTEIKWNNELSLIEYINDEDILKTEEVKNDTNFSTVNNNSYDVLLEKSILNNVDGYRLKYINQNDADTEYTIINKNDNEYYYNGNTPYSLTDTTTNVIYEKSVNLTVNYIDEEGKELAPSTIEQGWSSEEYTTVPIDIEGYELMAVPDNAVGVFTTQNVTVNYVYKKVPTVINTEPQEPTLDIVKEETTIQEPQKFIVVDTGDNNNVKYIFAFVAILIGVITLLLVATRKNYNKSSNNKK